MALTWFTADTHFQHFNIIKYVERPFKTVEDMDTELIRRWNSRVKINDTVYVLGDFYFHKSKKGNGGENKFEYYKSRLNGNIIFVKGNHEHSNDVKSNIISLVLSMGGIEIFCCHRPNDSNNFYKLNLVGHVHKNWKTKIDNKFGEKTILINVGVDVNNYYPISFQEVIEIYQKVKKKQPL